MQAYYYSCFNCHTNFSPTEIEENNHFLCPKCGSAPPNMPLKGVLLFRYDYERLKNIYTRQFLTKKIPGHFWEYPELWPLKVDPENRNAPFQGIERRELMELVLPCNKIHERKVAGHPVFLMDETNNPTNSYKDRASIIVALKARQLGIDEISCASTGNAGSSLAGVCACLGLKSNLWVPESIPEAKLMQILAFGAKVHLVTADYDTTFDLCLEISHKKGWYNRNTAFNPLTIEGKKSAAFDIFIEMQGKIPEHIFVPVGDGVILAGLYRGFQDLQNLGLIEDVPQLVAVQSKGSDALVRYVATGRFEYQIPETLADSISAGAPRNLYMAAHAVHESGGFAVAVEDSEIVEAQKMLGEETGLLVEPAAAASLAGYLKVQHKSEFENPDRSLLLLTGSGLKDMVSLKRLHRFPSASTPEIWRDCYQTD